MDIVTEEDNNQLGKDSQKSGSGEGQRKRRRRRNRTDDDAVDPNAQVLDADDAKLVNQRVTPTPNEDFDFADQNDIANGLTTGNQAILDNNQFDNNNERADVIGNDNGEEPDDAQAAFF